MAVVDLYINGKDARDTWGIVTTLNTLSQLLTPPPMKEYVNNSSRLEHGIRYDVSNPKYGQRDVTLEIQFTADSEDQFYERYSSFCEELSKGSLTVYTTDRPQVLYRFIFMSCTQFTQFRRGIATFSLKLVEPNPTDRSPWQRV